MSDEILPLILRQANSRILARKLFVGALDMAATSGRILFANSKW